MIDVAKLARRIVANDIQTATARINKELAAKPERKPVQYRGCGAPINTRERALRLKNR